MLEYSIFKSLLKDKTIYTSYYKYIKDIILEKELTIILNTINKYYIEYTEHSYISKDELVSYLNYLYPILKNKELIINIINNIYTIDTSDSLVSLLIKQLIEKDYINKIVQEGIPLLQGEKTTVLDEVELLVKEARAAIQVSSEEESIFVEDSLEELLDESDSTVGLRWRLKVFNDALGPLQGGTLGHIFARPDCYSEDTEILTSSGWKMFSHLTSSDKVAQVLPNRDINFVVPSNYIKQKYVGDMYHIHGSLNRMDLLVTPNHRMMYTLYDKTQRIKQAKDIIYFQGVKTYTSAKKLTGIKQLTPYERFLIAYQADGSTARQGCTGQRCKHFTVRFNFSKQRKSERLKYILNQTNLKYHIKTEKSRPNYFVYYVECPTLPPKDFSWIDLNQISTEWCKSFIDELSYWDGTRRTNERFGFSTTCTSVSETVQAICAIGDISCYYHKTNPTNPKHNSVINLSLRINHKPLDGQNIQKERIFYNGNIYCVTVPSGLLIVRRNKRVTICGNSGKSTCVISELAYFAKQLAGTDEKILWVLNEEKAQRLKKRLYCAIVGASEEMIRQNILKAKEIFQKHGGDNILIRYNPSIDFIELEELIKVHKPVVTIIDQGDKVSIPVNKGASETQLLQKLYKNFRRLCGLYNTDIITVGQCGSEGEGRKWLRQAWMNNSKTGKPGELDWALGIGKDLDASDTDNRRYFYFCKNKLNRGQHLKEIVLMDAEKARYKDM